MVKNYTMYIFQQVDGFGVTRVTGVTADFPNWCNTYILYYFNHFTREVLCFYRKVMELAVTPVTPVTRKILRVQPRARPSNRWRCA